MTRLLLIACMLVASLCDANQIIVAQRRTTAPAAPPPPTWVDPNTNFLWYSMGMTNNTQTNLNGYTRDLVGTNHGLLTEFGHPSQTQDVVTAGNTNYTYKFNGIGDKIKVLGTPNLLNGVTALTIQAWIKWVKHAEINALFCSRGVQYHDFDQAIDGTMDLWINSQPLDGLIIPPSNQWTMVTATWSTNDGIGRIYYDGVLVSSGLLSQSPLEVDNYWWINYDSSWGSQWDTWMDNLKIRTYVTSSNAVRTEWTNTYPTTTIEVGQ